MEKQVLTVGLSYQGNSVDGVHIDNLGLGQVTVVKEKSAFPLYEYDTIIINPCSFTHFMFGEAGKFSDSQKELSDLKRENESYDIDIAFDAEDRANELQAAIAAGTSVVWCLSEPKRMNFFGYRETYIGFVAPNVTKIVKKANLLIKRGRRIAQIDVDHPFSRYFETLSKTGWSLCLSEEAEGYTCIASSPEGYSLGGRVSVEATSGWLITPPSSQEATDQLIRDSIMLEKIDSKKERYHGIFLSHTEADKPFVRQLRDDLLGHNVPRVWVDEAEIQLGDSLIAKIDEGL